MKKSSKKKAKATKKVKKNLTLTGSRKWKFVDFNGDFAKCAEAWK
jgi:hypothetical protein